MTAGAKSKFTKEEKQEIWQYILETSIPGTVKLHRDFALERKLFNHRMSYIFKTRLGR